MSVCLFKPIARSRATGTLLTPDCSSMSTTSTWVTRIASRIGGVRALDLSTLIFYLTLATVQGVNPLTAPDLLQHEILQVHPLPRPSTPQLTLPPRRAQRRRTLSSQLGMRPSQSFTTPILNVGSSSSSVPAPSTTLQQPLSMLTDCSGSKVSIEMTSL